MKIVKTNLQKWENRHETFVEDIADLYIVANEPNLGALEGYNDTTLGLQQLIKTAIQNKVPLRCLGAGWSWTKIATVNKGIMIDTKQLNTTLQLSAQTVSPAYTGDIKKLLFAQCGNGIWELTKELGEKKQSLKTCGASNGQTIVGAMSTGTHGSCLDVGGVQDFVVGIHLITGPDTHIWLERSTAPVVSSALIEKLGTKLVQSDTLFNAALVCFGSFGIIHGVLLETDDLYLLETYRRRMPYDDVLKKMMNTLDFSNNSLPNGNERPFHFQVSINPYDLDNGAYVSSFYKRPYRSNYVKPVVNDAGVGPGDDAPCFIGKITERLPSLVPFAVNKLLANALKPYEKQFGTLGEIFNNTNLHGKLLSTAIGIPINKVTRVTELMLQLNKTKGPFVGLFAYRFIQKTGATLGFTRYKYTCILELDGVASNATSKFYAAVWQMLENENIPFTLHWGKINELNADRLKRMYGSDLSSWLNARNNLLDANTRKVFNNPILKQWGLD